ncbi:tRNA (guanine(10)-N(2))-methyltransferase [Sarracenia purpurea var. burkii]
MGRRKAISTEKKTLRDLQHEAGDEFLGCDYRPPDRKNWNPELGLLDYRKPEVESLAELFGAFNGSDGDGDKNNGYSENKGNSEAKSLQWRLPHHHHPDSPFHFVNLPSEDSARNIANRSILVKGIYELWGEGSTFEELEESIKAYPDERKLPYLTSESTFKITVDSFGKVISFEEQNDRIQCFSYIPFKGRVNLRNPDHKFWLMETDDYGSNNGLPPVVQKRIFFGREVGTADRKLLPTYQLKSRTYLGPTAMDAEMAFLMANQALTAPGKLVYDPFVGTGSILIAAAHFGAMTMGADIDIRVVRDGRGPNCNVWSNFRQYGLPMPIGLLRADNNLPPWRPGLKEVFDAIICDPPYGVRAGGRKSGGRKLLKGIVDPYIVPDDKRTDHIPSTAPYSLAECVHDLLDLAARMLVMGGRLVFFYPVLREEDTIDTNIPNHPCFKLIAACEQILSLRYSRVLLTMVKIEPYTKEIAEMARIKHREFKENHLKWLEDGNLRSAVFSPADPQLAGAGDTKFTKDSKPKYRGKYV